MLTFDLAGAQIDGARDYQEDAFLITRLGDSAGQGGAPLLIVADGMGGHAAGNVASNMAVQTFNKHLTASYPSNDASAVLRDAVRQANQSIAETVRETAALKGMGCTLVGALLGESDLRWVSVGDSHLYLLRRGELKKLNADHSYGGFLNRMAAEGRPLEPEAGFSRNMLMSALTGDDIADIDCPPDGLELKGGDRLILASDGLDTLSMPKVQDLLEKANSAREAADALLKAVQETRLPRQDNTTVIVAIVGEKAEFKPRIATPPPPVPQTLPTPPPAAASSRTSASSGESAPAGLPPGLVLGAGLVLVALLGGVGWWWSNRPPAAVTPAPHSTEPAPPAARQPELAAAEPPAAPAPPTATPAVAPPVRGKSFRDAGGPEMVWIEAGSYEMGLPDSSGEMDSRPRHTVALKRYAIGTHEVTVAEFGRYAATSGHRAPPGPREKMPVVDVSWEEAVAYTRWLSAQTGKHYRLPTEAEWEYAARAGTSTAYWWGRDIGKGNAHCFDCGSGLDPRQPAPVGQFAANPLGLYDTAGNVDEWVEDCYRPGYDGAPADGSAVESAQCTERVTRGGNYAGTSRNLRSTSRAKHAQSRGNITLGFRVARDP